MIMIVAMSIVFAGVMAKKKEDPKKPPKQTKTFFIKRYLESESPTKSDPKLENVQCYDCKNRFFGRNRDEALRRLSGHVCPKRKT